MAKSVPTPDHASDGPKGPMNVETPKRKRTPVPVNESKREKFVRIFSTRVSAGVDAIKSLKGLVNPNAYEYDDSDWAKGFAAIEGALESVKKHKPSGNGDRPAKAKSFGL